MEWKKRKVEILVGLTITVIGGVIIAIFQYYLERKDAAGLIPKPPLGNIDLKTFYTLDSEEIHCLMDKDSSTWEYNFGVKTAGFYITSTFNTYSGIKRSISVKKGEEYFCNRYDMKSIAAISGLSVHNPNIQQHLEVVPDYYNGTIKNGFAYYNPELIKWATDRLIPNPDEKNIQGFLFKDIYNELYRNNIRLLFESYLFFPDEESYLAAQGEYLKAMKSPNFNGTRYLFMKYGVKDGCEFCFEQHTAIGFWIRRGIDGTNDELWQSLSKFLRVYDKDWFHSKMITDKTIWMN